LLCNLSVTPGLSERDLEHSSPNVVLKFRSLELELQGKRLPRSVEILVQLPFGFDEHTMRLVRQAGAQPNAARIVVLPENARQALFACHEREHPDRRVHLFVMICQVRHDDGLGHGEFDGGELAGMYDSQDRSSTPLTLRIARVSDLLHHDRSRILINLPHPFRVSPRLRSNSPQN
jgi:hypothetical protein